MVSNSGQMQEVFRLVDKVKDSDICVLIMGESGTGKELVSKAIHHNGIRQKGPFVVVNCASIPTTSSSLNSSDMRGERSQEPFSGGSDASSRPTGDPLPR